MQFEIYINRKNLFVHTNLREEDNTPNNKKGAVENCIFKICSRDRMWRGLGYYKGCCSSSIIVTVN